MTDKDKKFAKDINVPRKEQIIIDGVDILDCDNYYVDQETDQVKCDLSDEYCRENKNCFYKQLARKTQECEELKDARFNLNCEIYSLNRYRKALDEIEKYCSNAQDPCQDNWTREKENFAKIILDIISKVKRGRMNKKEQFEILDCLESAMTIIQKAKQVKN